MKVTIILYPLFIFIFMLIIHIIIWRIFKPKKLIVFLFLIFIAIPLVIFLIYLIPFNLLNIQSNLTIQFQDFLFIALLYFSLAGAYIQTYPAVQAKSPSLQLVSLIGKEKSGVSITDLKKFFNTQKIIIERIRDLEEEGFITIKKEDTMIKLTKRGKILASIFILYRKLLGLATGEG